MITVVGTLCNTRGSHRDRPSLVAQFIFIARAALFGSQKNESGGASDLPFGRRARRCSSRVAGRSGSVSFRRPCATLRRLRAGRLASAGDRHATHVPRQHRGRRSNPAPNAPACPQKSVRLLAELTSASLSITTTILTTAPISIASSSLSIAAAAATCALPVGPSPLLLRRRPDVRHVLHAVKPVPD